MPKKRKPSGEEWKLDGNWNITSGKTFFHVSGVLHVAKAPENSIDVLFPGTKASYVFGSESSRDAVYDMITDVMSEYYKAKIKQGEQSRVLQEAMLATQKRIIQEHIQL